MGFCCYCICSHKHLYLLISLLLLCSSQVRFLAEGRAITKLLEVARKEASEEVMVRAMIGSRPPRCEKRCTTCDHCEAVQVPSVPQNRSGIRHFSTGINSRVDDNSNYKPLSWKCKCGDRIINP